MIIQIDKRKVLPLTMGKLDSATHAQIEKMIQVTFSIDGDEEVMDLKTASYLLEGYVICDELPALLDRFADDHMAVALPEDSSARPMVEQHGMLMFSKPDVYDYTVNVFVGPKTDDFDFDNIFEDHVQQALLDVACIHQEARLRVDISEAVIASIDELLTYPNAGTVWTQDVISVLVERWGDIPGMKKTLSAVLDRVRTHTMSRDRATALIEASLPELVALALEHEIFEP